MLAKRICERVASGQSAAQACRALKITPSFLLDWLAADSCFDEDYTRAREAQADKFAEEIITISDAARGGTSEEVQAARLRVDSRKWVAGRMKPQRWGDRVIHAGDAEQPVRTVNEVNLRGEWDEILRRRREAATDSDRDAS